MAQSRTNVNAWSLDTLTINSVALLGFNGPDNPTLQLMRGEEINESSNSTDEAAAFENRSAVIAFAPLEDLFTVIQTAFPDDNSGTSRKISYYDFTATVKGTNGVTWTVTGTGRFQEDLELAMNIRRAEALAMTFKVVRGDGGKVLTFTPSGDDSLSAFYY